MMKFNKQTKTLERLPSSDLKESEILERGDLQQAIVNSWDDFRTELRTQDLFLIGQEVAPHGDVGDRIDILAYSSEDNAAVVIELKRSKNKLQLLQAVTYGAMVASWTSSQLLEEARRQNVPDLADLEDILKDIEPQAKTKMVLVAEQFEPEVMIAADWLYRQYSVDIVAFGMNVFRRDSEVYFNLVQKYPLSELSDVYSLRKRIQRTESALPDMSWDEVATSLQYDWGAEAIQTCQRIKVGDAPRRRFGQIRTNWDGFNWISINFRRAYVNVYLKGNPDGAEQLIQSKFKNQVEIGTWRDGFSCKVESASQYRDLIKWLQIGHKRAA